MEIIKTEELRKFRNIQDAFNAMISEEYIAGTLYLLWATGPKENCETCDLLHELFQDELDDHFLNLCNVAKSMDLKVPASIDDFLKHADEVFVKAYKNDMKQSKDILWYIDEAIAGERAAIKSYFSVINQFQSEMNENFEMSTVVNNNYFEEIDHLDKLLFLREKIQRFRSLGYDC